MACTKNDSTELAIASTIGESEWEGSVGCYHDVITLRTKLWHRQWSKQVGGNSVQTSKSGSIGTENPLNWVVVLLTTVQIVLFDYHGSQIFEDKYDEICLAGSHGNESNLPPEIRQDQAPTFVSHHSQPGLVPINHNLSPFKSPSNNSCIGLNDCNWLHEAQACFQGSRSVISHISVNAIARSHRLLKYQPWLTTEEWRSYFYSCDRDNPHTAIPSFYKQLCPHPTLWAACLL